MEEKKLSFNEMFAMLSPEDQQKVSDDAAIYGTGAIWIGEDGKPVYKPVKDLPALVRDGVKDLPR